MEIKNSATIITGASSGIGLATARRFAAAGARVVLAARSEAVLERTAAQLRQAGHTALAVRTDMTIRSDVEHLMALACGEAGRIDVLINNAGQAAAGRVADLNEEDMRRIMDLNVFGPLYAMQAAVPRMRAGGGGVIINVSSMVTKMHIVGLAAYASTKAALNMLSDTARAELAPENIRVITVYPRLTATDFGKNSLGTQALRERQRAPSDMTADSAEFVAEKILLAALHEPAEQFMMDQ